MNTTRILTIDDKHQMVDMLFDHQSISKVLLNQSKEEIDADIDHIFYNELTRPIGHFIGDRLISFIVQSISERISYWHMTLLCSRSNRVWNYKLNGLEECWRMAMEFAELRNINKVYWAMPAQWATSQRRTITTSDVWQRYEIFIENIIPAGEYPQWLDHAGSFGKRLKPNNTVIKLGILKNEYRSVNTRL